MPNKAVSLPQRGSDRHFKIYIYAEFGLLNKRLGLNEMKGALTPLLYTGCGGDRGK